MTSIIRHRRENDVPDRISNGRHHYQIGAEIGRGGFAVVYQAFNVEMGEFVAVKRFPLEAIDAESLSSIEAEIELMKKLNHANIVKYVDTIRTQSYLHIVLEYMENGSLQHVIKKFGAFTESLTAIYITQVLRVLKYLHEQGVLHRDIKGANILTTKDGQVKLADFGVAMKLTEAHVDEHDVVGTPYWMAPEIIEMSAPTTACDIWSVGCTIVELLTSKPPYFDLSPMAALFRIVQDDYPAFPEGISPALRDFLSLCFQKEPTMRGTAAKLLDHPWLQNPDTHLNRTSELISTNMHTPDLDDETRAIVNTLKLFQKDVKAAISVSSSASDIKEVKEEVPVELDIDVDFMDDDMPTPPRSKLSLKTLDEDTASRSSIPTSSIADIAAFLGGEKDAEELDWDEPDEEPTPVRKPLHVRGNSSVNPTANSTMTLKKYQDKAEDDLTDDFVMDNIAPRKPDAKNATNITNELQLRMKQSTAEADGDGFDDFLNAQFDEHDFQQSENRDVHMRRSREIRQLMARIKPDSAEKEVVDLCNQLYVMFESFPEQREHLITHHGVLPVLDMLEARSGYRPNIPVLDMLEARSGNVRPHVLKVINKIVEGSTRAQEQLSLVGLIPIVMRLLEYSPNVKEEKRAVDPVVLEAGRFVHQISSTSSLTLQMLIGAGGLPVLVNMIAYSSQMLPCSHLTSLSSNEALSSAEDARRMVYMGLDCIMQVFSVQSSRTRDFCKLFVKLGLLPHLCTAFQHVMALPFKDGSGHLNGRGDETSDMEEALQCKYAHHIATIFWNFSRYEVAEQMASDGVFDVIMSALQVSSLKDPIGKFRHLYDRNNEESNLSVQYVEIVELLLKCVKHLSMEPTALVELERSGAIATLLPLLSGPIRDKCKNHVLSCVFNLCRINKRRQEVAVVHGIIPHLMSVIHEKSHLRQFALSIMCDLAHTSATTRQELWNNNGVVFYINLLSEEYWQTFALNSLAVWLANDTARVEDLLAQPANVIKLIEFFRKASSQTITSLHKPLLDMMSKSRLLCRSLGCSGLFVSAIVKRLSTAEAIVLRSLLKMLQFIHQHHPFPRQLVLDHNLYSIVRKFAKEEGQVLVNQMANRLLRDFQASTLS